jgi:hypothetical protein
MPTARDLALQLPRAGISHRMRGSMPPPGRDDEWEGTPVAVTGSGGMAAADLAPYTHQDEDSEAACEPPYWATWGF